MKTSNAVIWLSSLIIILALVAAGTGLFWQNGGSAYPFTTLRGQTVQIYGQGLYHYDSVFNGAGNRGVDAAIFGLGVPLLAICTLCYRRGSLKWGLMLTGTLGYFLYVYISYAFNAAYNNLFLVYVAIFSASFFGFVLALTAVDLPTLSAHFTEHIPRRSLAVFMFASGLLTLVAWGEPIVTALVTNQPPLLLDSYTTLVTYALDLAVITPTTFLTGVLVQRRSPLGYVLSFPLLVLIMLLAPQIAAQTISQLSAGLTFSPGQIIGPIAGFAVLGLIAIWLLVSILRNISDASPRRGATFLKA